MVDDSQTSIELVPIVLIVIFFSDLVRAYRASEHLLEDEMPDLREVKSVAHEEVHQPFKSHARVNLEFVEFRAGDLHFVAAKITRNFRNSDQYLIRHRHFHGHRKFDHCQNGWFDLHGGRHFAGDLNLALNFHRNERFTRHFDFHGDWHLDHHQRLRLRATDQRNRNDGCNDGGQQQGQKTPNIRGLSRG